MQYKYCQESPTVGEGFYGNTMICPRRTTEMGARSLVSATGLGPESHGKFWTNDKQH